MVKLSVLLGLAPQKTNMDTQNDGLEKVTPFKHGNCWYHPMFGLNQQIVQLPLKMAEPKPMLDFLVLFGLVPFLGAPASGWWMPGWELRF